MPYQFISPMNNLNIRKLPALRLIAGRLWAIMAVMLMAAAMSTVRAQETGGTALKVHMKTGAPQLFMLASEPVITFEGTECRIVSAELDARYDMSEIDHAEIVAQPASVEEQLKDQLVVDLTNPGQIIIRGMTPGAEVFVVNLAGVVLRRAGADADGTALIDVSDLPAALYIVSSKDTTFKYIKR